MKVRNLVLALALAVIGTLGVAQAATPKHPKAPNAAKLAKAAKFKSSKINTKNQSKFKASHNIPSHQKVKAAPKHSAPKVTTHKFVKPKS
jgi:hypothetical protein